MLIGLLGRAQSGKSTVAKMLVEEFNFIRVAFADPLKEMLITAGMVTSEEVYGQKTEMSRFLLQKVGTEIFRKQIDPLYWVKEASGRIENLLVCGVSVVVDDVRFPEEAEAIKQMEGGVIKIERVDFVDEQAGTTHDSERFVDSIEYDHVIRAETGVEGLKALARELFAEVGV